MQETRNMFAAIGVSSIIILIFASIGYVTQRYSISPLWELTFALLMALNLFTADRVIRNTTTLFTTLCFLITTASIVSLYFTTEFAIYDNINTTPLIFLPVIIVSIAVNNAIFIISQKIGKHHANNV